MSHNISAFSLKSGLLISFISVEPFNQGKSWILYESLSCTDCNSGVSGGGSYRVISEEKLKTSFLKFKYLLGEPEKETLEVIKNTRACKLSREILQLVLKAIGSRPCPGDFKMVLDRDSAEDVERFLSELQNVGDIVVEFK